MKDSVDDVLGADHEHLDDLFQTLKREVASGTQAASDALRQFEIPLRHHMKWEEEDLFPAVREHATQKEKRSIE